MQSVVEQSVLVSIGKQSYTRSPIDLVAVVDVSGSMAGSKLMLVKDTLLFVVEQLTERDRLAIVVFGSSFRTILPLTHLFAHHKENAANIIKGIRTEGQTLLSGGLYCGKYCLFAQHGNGVFKIMLGQDLMNLQKNLVGSVMLVHRWYA